MKTAVIILAVFFVIGFLVAIGTVVFGFGSFSKSLPKGEGGTYEFSVENGKDNFKKLTGSAGLRAKDFIFSKANDNVIYLGTAREGIWVSKDNGETFVKALDKVFEGKVDVYDIEEDNSGNLYSSIYSYKDDRGSLVYSSYPPESSAEIYFSSIPRYGVFGSSVDGGGISIISSDGGFYRSSNNGKSWELRSRQGEGLLQMESFGGTKYVLTSKNKILATSDLGRSWKDVSPKSDVAHFHLDKRTGFVVALSDKILFSQNGGASWRELNLLVSPGDLPVIAVAISPTNSNVVYAVSEKILYRSLDGGNSWSVFEIPAGKITDIFVDAKKPNSLFISTQ